MFNKRIYYLSGFDPRGARFYHRLFREESKKSAALSGAKIETGKRKVLDNDISQWQIDSVWQGQSYKVDYRVMTWDEVMKFYWIRNVWMLILKSIPMYFNHIKIRLFPKFKKAGRGPYFCSIYPLVFCSLSLLLSAAVGFLIYIMISGLFSQFWLALVLAVLAAFYVIQYAVRLGESLNVWWILQTYYFISIWQEKPLPELEVKLQLFAERIIQDQLENPVDEIILVGHCVGSMLAIEVMSRIINLDYHCLKGRLSVMTLGQCIPYLSYAPKAIHFRQALQQFANSRMFPWFDMGAKADPLCFQLVNPALAEGIVGVDESVPYRFVVRPYNMFSAAKYKELKKNKLRMHFQYLMAADIKTDFDYFEIVTGPFAKINNYKN